MAVRTILLDFKVEPCLDIQKSIRDIAEVLSCVAKTVGQEYVEKGCIPTDTSSTHIYSGPEDSFLTIKHYFREGLLTLSLECLKSDTLFSTYGEVEELRELVISQLEAETGTCCPAVKRCFPPCEGTSPVMWTSDDRLLEFKWEELLFSEKSPFQLVEIFQTKDFGATLFLDGMINLAESDLAYTRGLMGNGTIDYKDKEVLVLGGGDGALLHELQQEKRQPGFVTMVDIDEAVMRGCRQHMRSVCGNVLDHLETDKYRIIVDDAFKWLQTFKDEDRKFDIIFADLTDIPVHSKDTETWAFIRNILSAALHLLPIGGRYITHANGACSSSSLVMFEKLVEDLGVPVEVSRTDAVVPSFHERWVFYQLTRKEDSS